MHTECSYSCLLLTSPSWNASTMTREALWRVHRATLVAREGSTELRSRALFVMVIPDGVLNKLMGAGWKETLISGGSALPPLSHRRHTWVILCTKDRDNTYMGDPLSIWFFMTRFRVLASCKRRSPKHGSSFIKEPCACKSHR